MLEVWGLFGKPDYKDFNQYTERINKYIPLTDKLC